MRSHSTDGLLTWSVRYLSSVGIGRRTFILHRVCVLISFSSFSFPFLWTYTFLYLQPPAVRCRHHHAPLPPSVASESSAVLYLTVCYCGLRVDLL